MWNQINMASSSSSSLTKPIISFSILIFIALSSTYSNAATFTVRNNCPDTVWAAATPGGGTQLGSGQTWTFDVPAGTTAARVWARTGCSFDGSGQGKCDTGDCGRLECQGYGVHPSTLAEYTLNGYMNFDYIDISLIEGFNVPMEFSPTDSRGCNTQGIRCAADINAQCPGQLRAQGGCNNPCSAFGNCEPSDLTRFFKDKCPETFTYPNDNDRSQFSCPGGTNYRVVFCP